MKRDEEIVNIAKQKEESQVFCDLVKSPLSLGVNSAYGVGFIEGAKWADEYPSMEQKQQFVDKAWQWIYRVFVITAPLDFQQAIEKEFRKEMNGE